MPHPTLIGANNPIVPGADMIQFKKGLLHETNLEPGHFKPNNDALQAVGKAFENCPKHPEF